MIEPGPILLSTTNFALNAVAKVISEPNNSTVLIFIFGFIYLSLEISQITSTTVASAIWSVKICLKATPQSGFCPSI